jgi:hypothetical protein
MDKQKTAVDFLMDKLFDPSMMVDDQLKWFEQAKEMEKEQNKHAYDWGETNGADECNGAGATHENFEQYYQETYGGNK